MGTTKKGLVIDDELAIRRLLQTAFKGHGIEVIEATTGSEGISQAITSRPDFILLDLGLPDGDGLDVLSKLREWYKAPVLILSVKDQEETIVKALDRGADDYLTKPFNVNELLARIRAAERRHLTGNEGPVIKSDSVVINLADRTVRKDGQDVRLTATEYDVLKVLAQNVGRVLTHRQLLNTIWGPNASEHVQYLRVYIAHLRQKLESDPNRPAILVTEPGVGYRLVGCSN